MGSKYSYDEIKQEFEIRGYKLVTDHIVKSTEKYEYICLKHQEKGSQFIGWGHFHYSNHGCYYCGREKSDKSRQKDLSEYDGKTLAESKGFEYVDIVKHDRKVWVRFICPKHRQYGVQEMPFNNMSRVVVGCQHCIGRNDDEAIVLDEMYNANPNIELLEPYRGRTKRIKMRCVVHNVISNKTPAEVIRGKGCVKCGADKLSKQAKLPIEVFIRRLEDFSKDIQLIDGYTAVGEYASFSCSRCKTNFIDYPSYVLRRGCPVCGGSSQEQKVSKILDDLNIKYIRQYCFPGCKDQRPLPFDFYLQDYNTVIEYDGEQHYMPVNFGGIDDDKARENFLIVQKHDNIKNIYCQQHKINLIRIPYWDKQNIEKIIYDNIKCN